MVPRVYRLCERRCEKMDIAEFAGSYFVDRIQRSRLEVQAAGNHELCCRSLGRIQDFSALLRRDLKRFFRQNMDSGIEGWDNEFCMSPVRRCQVDRIKGDRKS